MHPVRTILLLMLLASSPAVGMDSPQPCSGSGFLASDYYWSGVPVMHNARQAVGDNLRCLYVVPVSVEVAEQWHNKKLAEEGWQWTKGEPTERGIALEFRKADRIVRIVIDDIEFATAVLVKQPVFVAPER